MRIYRGSNFIVNDYITIHQPTLNEICDYGECDYYSMIYAITATPADLIWQLTQLGIDYTGISDYELFCDIICSNYDNSKTSIILGNLDLSKFHKYKNNNTEEITLVDIENNIEINIDTYHIITDYIRKVHGIQKNEKRPANEKTKLILIEDAMEEYEYNKNKVFESQLLNFISAMVNSSGFKYNHAEVWNMKINAFMDSVKRISKIKMADLLLQSGYSGYGIDLKNVNKKQINWLGEL